MNLICKITDKDIGEQYEKLDNPQLRLGARGIVIRDDGKISHEDAIDKEIETNEMNKEKVCTNIRSLISCNMRDIYQCPYCNKLLIEKESTNDFAEFYSIDEENNIFEK